MAALCSRRPCCRTAAVTLLNPKGGHLTSQRQFQGISARAFQDHGHHCPALQDGSNSICSLRCIQPKFTFGLLALPINIFVTTVLHTSLYSHLLGFTRISAEDFSPWRAAERVDAAACGGGCGPPGATGRSPCCSPPPWVSRRRLPCAQVHARV